MSKKQQANLFENLDDYATWKKDWVGMPEFVQEDLQPFQKIIVSFETKEDVENFAKLVGQKITYKTQSIWFPKRDKDLSIIKIYNDEP